jgi:hypothetical protein
VLIDYPTSRPNENDRRNAGRLLNSVVEPPTEREVGELGRLAVDRNDVGGRVLFGDGDRFSV